MAVTMRPSTCLAEAHEQISCQARGADDEPCAVHLQRCDRVGEVRVVLRELRVVHEVQEARGAVGKHERGERVDAFHGGSIGVRAARMNFDLFGDDEWRCLREGTKVWRRARRCCAGSRSDRAAELLEAHSPRHGTRAVSASRDAGWVHDVGGDDELR